MDKVVSFLKEAKSELERVNWPSKQQTINYTLIVIGISIATAAFLGGLDWIFEGILKKVLM